MTSVALFQHVMVVIGSRLEAFVRSLESRMVSKDSVHISSILSVCMSESPVQMVHVLRSGRTWNESSRVVDFGYSLFTMEGQGDVEASQRYVC